MLKQKSLEQKVRLKAVTSNTLRVICELFARVQGSGDQILIWAWNTKPSERRCKALPEVFRLLGKFKQGEKLNEETKGHGAGDVI
jgi:hypothetical protein